MTLSVERPVFADEPEAGARWALKMLAADQRLRDAFLDSSQLATIFKPAADRYIVAAGFDELRPKLDLLAGKGYRTGVEQVGEEARTVQEVTLVIGEYLALIERLRRGGQPDTGAVQLGFDLSNVGMLESRSVAVENTARLLDAAAEVGSSIVISMERSEFVDGVLAAFAELAVGHDNVGLTVQAHLHRTADDLPAVLATGRKIRLVKGVYRESADVALPRSSELVDRYVELAVRIVEAGAPLAVATHDAVVLERLRSIGLLQSVVEVEMLHGVQPTLLRELKSTGVPCRIATVYGANWWLHFLHRLSEYPQNVVTALADLADPGRIQFGSLY